MSYSYYGNDELLRSLETNVDDDDAVHSCEGRTNIYTTAGYQLIHEASKCFTAPNNTFSVLHSNPAAKTGVVTGAVRLILPCRTFTQRNGRPGFVQTFIVVDSLAQRLNSAVWRYKIIVWNEQAKNLNIEMNRVYRFDHFKMKSVKGNSSYPGQDDYKVHLTALSTITKVSV